ncbi:MAG: amidohydrolase [Pseudomonadales bacterium]|jgi:predicted amidohydrolase YtcJ|nr:amidohydrolase [Pseudomonadales bacterium]
MHAKTPGVRSLSLCLVALLWACGGEAPSGAASVPERSAGAAAAGVADLVLTGGNIYTFSWPEPARDGTPSPEAPRSAGGWQGDAEAIAFRGGRILAVGRAEALAAHLGPDTEVVDLAGATVVPGLVDSHTHLFELGAALSRVPLFDVATEEEAVARVLARAAETPPGEWIVGQGWDEGAWADHYPDKQLLSDALPDHPVFLRGLHGFAGWVNQRALDEMGIDGTTPSPSGGEIRKGADGEPTGLFLNRAVPLLDAAIPPPTLAQRKAQVVAAMRQMAADGYVTVHEAGTDAESVEALQALAAEDALPIRFYAMLSLRDPELMRAWIDRGPQMEMDHRLVVRAVKGYYDGSLGARGAQLLEDYSDRPGNRGVAGAEYGFDQALAEEAMGRGFQLAIHAIGDAANRATLDFYEQVHARDPATRAGRHRIEHAQVVSPADVPRFGALGVIASMEPPHAVEDKGWAEERLGADRILGAYAWRSLRSAGARLTFNADNPGSDHDIFYGLHAAITRRDKALQPEGGWYAEQALTGEETLRAYTGWSAYAAFMEQDSGVLAPGRWADVTVMDIDPLALAETDPGAILDGRILMTIVDGEIVYRR